MVSEHTSLPDVHGEYRLQMTSSAVVEKVQIRREKNRRPMSLDRKDGKKRKRIDSDQFSCVILCIDCV
jgi:hypothetical protein